MTDYRYIECGLDNVIITGLVGRTSDDGKETFTMPNLFGLHRVISQCLIKKKTGLNGKELRFLRTEIGITQGELALILKKDQQTVGRWERGETPIDQTAEVLIRILASERLELDGNMSVEQVAELCLPTASVPDILIDGSDPRKWKALVEKMAA